MPEDEEEEEELEDGKGQSPKAAVCKGELWRIVSRSPSSALLPAFLGEGSPTKIDYIQKKRVPLF